MIEIYENAINDLIDIQRYTVYTEIHGIQCAQKRIRIGLETHYAYNIVFTYNHRERTQDI